MLAKTSRDADKENTYFINKKGNLVQTASP